jgi:hypothetical protein
MDDHQFADLTVLSRSRWRSSGGEGCPLKEAAACFNVSAKTASKCGGIGKRVWVDCGTAACVRTGCVPHCGGDDCPGGGFTTPALDRSQHRPVHRPEPGHGQPHPAQVEAEPDARPRSEAVGAPTARPSA